MWGCTRQLFPCLVACYNCCAEKFNLMSIPSMINRTLIREFENKSVDLGKSVRHFYSGGGYLFDTETMQVVFHSSLADGRVILGTGLINCILISSYMRCSYCCVKSQSILCDRVMKKLQFLLVWQSVVSGYQNVCFHLYIPTFSFVATKFWLMIFKSRCHIMRKFFIRLYTLNVSIMNIRGYRNRIWSRTLNSLEFNGKAISNISLLWFSINSFSQCSYNSIVFICWQGSARFVVMIAKFLV